LFTTWTIVLALAIHLRTPLRFTRIFGAWLIIFRAFIGLITPRLITIGWSIFLRASLWGRRHIRF